VEKSSKRRIMLDQRLGSNEQSNSRSLEIFTKSSVTLLGISFATLLATYEVVFSSKYQMLHYYLEYQADISIYSSFILEEKYRITLISLITLLYPIMVS